MPIRVLSIDGGGIRGILPATVLTALEERSGHPVADLFDLIIGTSTGGILALGLVAPNARGGPAYSARDLLRLYHARGSQIFPLGGEPVVKYSGLLGTRTALPAEASFGDRVKHFMGYENINKLVAPLGGHGNARYPATGLMQVLLEYLGDVRLRQARRRVGVTSYEYVTRQPWIFRSYLDTEDPLMRDVARATSAGPTFFPVATVAGVDGQFIDGGVVANDPAFIAFMEALNLARAASLPPDIILVSVGSGMPAADVPIDDDVPLQLVDRMNWARLAGDHLMAAIFNGGAQAQRLLLHQLLNASDAGDPQRTSGYWRYQTTLEEANFAMDDARPENLVALQRDADRLVAETAALPDPLIALLRR